MLWWLKGLAEDHKFGFLWKLGHAVDIQSAVMLHGYAEDHLASLLALWVG